MTPLNRSLLSALPLLLSSTLAWSADAHQHGVVRLMLVQEGNAVSLMLDAPLDSLVGFEHAPRNAKQKAALAKAATPAANPQALFALPAEAGCEPGATDVDMPHDGGHHHGHDHGHDADHADASAQVDYRCAHPEQLDRVELKLLGVFKRIERVDAEAATDRGQGKAVVRRGAPTWTLPRP